MDRPGSLLEIFWKILNRTFNRNSTFNRLAINLSKFSLWISTFLLKNIFTNYRKVWIVSLFIDLQLYLSFWYAQNVNFQAAKTFSNSNSTFNWNSTFNRNNAHSRDRPVRLIEMFQFCENRSFNRMRMLNRKIRVCSYTSKAESAISKISQSVGKVKIIQKKKDWKMIVTVFVILCKH